MLKNFFTSALMLVTSASLAQNVTSVADLHLGMSSSQVKAALGSYTEKMQKPTVFPGEPYSSQLVKHVYPGYQNKNNDTYYLLYVDDKLIFIRHDNQWPEVQTGPNVQITSQQLIAKFGKTSYSYLDHQPGNGDHTVHHAWQWNAAGQFIPTRQPCELAFPTQLFPQGVQSNCGIEVMADERGNGPSRDEAILTSLTLAILDGKKFYDSLLQQQKRLQGQQQKETDAAKKRQAPL